MVLRPGELQLTRGESVRDTALVLSRHVAAIALRTGSEATLRELAEHAERAGGQHALARAPPVPGARRPDDDARGVRRARGAPAHLRRRRQQRRALARGRRRARRAWRSPSPRRPATSSRTARARVCSDDPVAAAEGADVLYTDVWVSMSDDEATAEAAAGRARRLPDRRRPARPRRAGRVRPALPARAPGRGDLGRCSTAGASGSGTRRRTAATPRRRCSSSSSRSLRRVVDPRDVVVITRARLQEVVDEAVARGRITRADAAELARRADHGPARPRAAASSGQAPDRRLRRPDRRRGRARARRLRDADLRRLAGVRAREREPQDRARRAGRAQAAR